jgi:hypothetical protein
MIALRRAHGGIVASNLGEHMNSNRSWLNAILSIAVVAFATLPLRAQQVAVSIGATDIGGVVTGANGPEAGVWVIAETNDLPTKYAKIVVTDDQGRYVVPDLPKANYDIWVRGYGLVDSPKVQGTPGKLVDLKATPAPTASAAAQKRAAVRTSCSTRQSIGSR